MESLPLSSWERGRVDYQMVGGKGKFRMGGISITKVDPDNFTIEIFEDQEQSDQSNSKEVKKNPKSSLFPSFPSFSSPSSSSSSASSPGTTSTLHNIPRSLFLETIFRWPASVFGGFMKLPSQPVPLGDILKPLFVHERSGESATTKFWDDTLEKLRVVRGVVRLGDSVFYVSRWSGIVYKFKNGDAFEVNKALEFGYGFRAIAPNGEEVVVYDNLPKKQFPMDTADIADMMKQFFGNLKFSGRSTLVPHGQWAIPRVIFEKMAESVHILTTFEAVGVLTMLLKCRCIVDRTSGVCLMFVPRCTTPLFVCKDLEHGKDTAPFASLADLLLFLLEQPANLIGYPEIQVCCFFFFFSFSFLFFPSFFFSPPCNKILDRQHDACVCVCVFCSTLGEKGQNGNRTLNPNSFLACWYILGLIRMSSRLACRHLTLQGFFFKKKSISSSLIFWGAVFCLLK